MTEDRAAALKRAASDYRRAKKRADDILRPAREALTEQVRAAYDEGSDDGMRKADILRAIDHLWSRQWLDEVLAKDTDIAT